MEALHKTTSRLDENSKGLNFGKFCKPETLTKQQNRRSERENLLNDFKSCSLETDLRWGMIIHGHAFETRSCKDMYVVNALIHMYCKCGRMTQACSVFDNAHKHDLVSWNALLFGYADNGEANMALDVFSLMKSEGFSPNNVTYIAALKACIGLRESGLQRGREIHKEVGCHSNQYVQNTVIDMYSKCGCMEEAQVVFDNIVDRNVVSWNALLMGYVENRKPQVALDLFSKMKADGYEPNYVTYMAALKACTSLAMSDVPNEGLRQGRGIHLEIGCHLNCCVQSTLIVMYSKCGVMEDARTVFDTMLNPDVVSWNALVFGYVENGEGHAALALFSRMKSAGNVPDSVTYIGVLKACGMIGALSLGRKFHLEMREYTSKVVTCLVDFYGKCGSILDSLDIFEAYPTKRSISTWNALLAGYSRLGDSESVFQHFQGLQDEGFHPDGITFICMLLCCSHAGLLESAREYFEAFPRQWGVSPTLMHYTCMVDALGRGNQLNEAIGIIRKMPYDPNARIWTTLLAGCCKWKNLEIGREAFLALVDMGKVNASPYVLMSRLCRSRSNIWEFQELVSV